jgi:hypothetical protein
MRKILSLSMLILSISTFAQSDIDNLIKGSAADANYLVKGYVTPALNTIGFGLNQGWYNTAAAHKLFGFDLTLTASPIFFPNSDLTYRVDNNALSRLTLNTVPLTGSGDVPTIFGADTRPQYRDKTTNEIIDGPPGLDLDLPLVGNAAPMAMVQLGIGLPKGTDLKVRFFPSTSIGGGSVSMFGFGIMHDIKQYIPGVKKLPFDLSGFFGYTSLKFDVGLNSSKPDQKANFNTTATTIQALISKKIAVLTLYGGLGYNFVSSDLNVKGKYDLDNAGQVTVTDPISISTSNSGPRITAGLRLKFAIFTLHGDYTFQTYNSLSLGFGFNVR